MPRQNGAVEVTAKEFEQLGQRLEDLHHALPHGEQEIFEWLMNSVGAPLATDAADVSAELTINFPPLKQTKIPRHPPAGGRLILGGNDGLTIIIKANGRIIVVPPEGPGPVENG